MIATTPSPMTHLSGPNAHHIVAIDHGTTSTRAIVFDHAARIVSTGQLPHSQHHPAPGWVEHDLDEVWANTGEVIGQALGRAGLTRHDIAAVGLTNQRETTAVWDLRTGVPIGRAIVWQDIRTTAIVQRLRETLGEGFFTARTGLPLSEYFSVSKLLWILEQVPGARIAADAGHLAFGTMDSWLLWNLTGGVDGGVRRTDVTNASRTGLMNLRTRCWDEDILESLQIPRSLLPEIMPSVTDFGTIGEHSLLRGIRITAVLGDQQASLLAHGATSPGDAKCTYGTGGFVMIHTGEQVTVSESGLVSTLACQFGDDDPTYALEGSIAVAGSLVQWLRDGLGLVADADELESFAASVPDNGGVVIVPAFSGLYAPHWRADARGTIVGLTSYATRQHFARAALEAIALQVDDVIDAAQRDSGRTVGRLFVDGGASRNDVLMQCQADILGVPLHRPSMVEMTALGAAYAAGIGAGFWSDLDEVASLTPATTILYPEQDDAWRESIRDGWARALERSFGWVVPDQLTATA